MALGSREISNSLARAIEEKLGLSEKWMDRDNRKFFEMDTLDYEVCSRMLCLTKSTKSNLLDFLDSLNNSA